MKTKKNGHKLKPWIATLAGFLGIALCFMVLQGCDDERGKNANSDTQTPLPTKNVIVMIADGQGFNHSKAASLYEYGEEDKQVYNDFPITLAMSTYPDFAEDDACYQEWYDTDLAWSDYYYVEDCETDSAAAATAMATGYKTDSGSIGVDINDNIVANIVEVAEDYGKATGIVTTKPITDGTPAGFSAHNVSRGASTEIAAEMINESGLDVLMGAGHPFYDNDSIYQVEPDYRTIGEEDWNALIDGAAGGDADGDGINDPWTLIQTRTEFQLMASATPPSRVLGIAKAARTIQQLRSGDEKADPYVVPFTDNVPTLVEMTDAALNILKTDPEGFFLLIEGGAVDDAAHGSQSGRMIEEEICFERAVEAVIDWVEANSNWDETILIVTADHETGHLNGPGSIAASEALPLESNGINVLPGMEWAEPSAPPEPPPGMPAPPPGGMIGHTNSLVPLWAKGTITDRLLDYADEDDLVRGAYLDNTELAEFLFSAVEEP